MERHKVLLFPPLPIPSPSTLLLFFPSSLFSPLLLPLPPPSLPPPYSQKLHDLNNLHSLKAVVAGLQSTPIYRLTQTWKSVSKRERAIFERLGEFLSDENNR